MGFGTAVSTCFKKYVDFQSRARRSEYWFFALFNFLVAMVLVILMGVLGGAGGSDGTPSPAAQIISILFLVYALGVFLPGLAVTVRRLHDTDHSGWWIFISIVPLIGPILLLVWYCTRGTSGPNRFGPDPTA